MQLDLGGHPIHTRALSVVLARRADGKIAAGADMVDLRKRGFCPVGTALQGAGVIHQMGVDAVVGSDPLVLEKIEARQAVVAFEASPDTRGESCRDVTGALSELAGTPLDARSSEKLREVMGGPRGCSHLLVAAQLLCATVSGAAQSGVLEHFSPAAGRLLRRDLVFDGSELDEGRMAIAVQLGDLYSSPAPRFAAPMESFDSHFELRLRMELDGWPVTIHRIDGAARLRTRADFAQASWRDCDGALAPLRGLSLGKGATRELVRRLGDSPPLLDAMLMLGPTLIQCRASFPDKWLNVAATRPGHPGLIGMPDSCYMWRRGGALERNREETDGTGEIRGR